MCQSLAWFVTRNGLCLMYSAGSWQTMLCLWTSPMTVLLADPELRCTIDTTKPTWMKCIHSMVPVSGLVVPHHTNCTCVNTLRPVCKRHFQIHFPEWKCFWIRIKMSPKFGSKSPVNNIPALVQIMTWWRPDNKPLSEPMTIINYWHIYIYDLSLEFFNNIYI